MATSGQINTNTTYESYFWVKWEQVGNPDITNNRTQIKWTCGLYSEHKFYSNAVRMSAFSINETQVFNGGTYSNFTAEGNQTIASGTMWINHNADGTKTFSISSFTGWLYSNHNYSSNGGSYALTTIPRASSISCSSVNIESNPTITISRASNAFAHTITYKFGTLTGTIADKTSATVISSWTIPATFYAQIPNAKTGKGTLTCITYNGNSQIGDPTTCELSVTTDESKCKPTVSGDVIDSNPATVALTGDAENRLVRFFSTALCTIDVTLNKKAGSVSLRTINNISVPSGTNTLAIPNVETGVFDFYAKDSRTYHDDDKVERTLVPYVRLTNDATVYRDEPTTGNATLKIEGNYYDGSFGVESNALTVKYKIDNGDYIEVTPTISDNKYSATVPLSGFDYQRSFKFDVLVSDKLGSVSKSLTLMKGIPVFDWGEDDFQFNVPVYINGNDILAKLTALESLISSLTKE
jgi:hypothetical protein